MSWESRSTKQYWNLWTYIGDFLNLDIWPGSSMKHFACIEFSYVVMFSLRHLDCQIILLEQLSQEITLLDWSPFRFACSTLKAIILARDFWWNPWNPIIFQEVRIINILQIHRNSYKIKTSGKLKNCQDSFKPDYHNAWGGVGMILPNRCTTQRPCWGRWGDIACWAMNKTTDSRL